MLFLLFLSGAAAWPQYSGLREVDVLDGNWLFGFNASKDFDAMEKGFDPKDVSLTEGALVPSSVDAMPPGVLGRRGVAFYRTSFEQKGHARLQFMGCSFYCRVFVDGEEVGQHLAGGYVPFYLDLKPMKGRRELFVLADNRFNRTTAPLHTGGDFWHYGGLVRSVLLHHLSASPWIWRGHVLPKEDLRHVDVQLKLTVAFSGPLEVSVAFDNEEEEVLHCTASLGTVNFTLEVPKPRIWSLKKPELHVVRFTSFGASITERFGLRWWSVQDGQVMLNGAPVKLHGWNHHTQWPDTGASPTEKQLDEDLSLLRDGHANFLRGAHYPQDQRWLDRLDEAGFAMWEEALGPGVSVKDIQDPLFMKYQLQQMEEMMEASMNHPSIMLWGWFNEGPSDDPKACPGYAACAQLAAKDPTRFRSWASSTKVKDKCLEHATVVSFNDYPAWYTYQHDLSAPARTWDAYAAWAKEQFPSKPFLMSETGAAGIYEWANESDNLWSLRYQQEVIERDVDTALSNQNISGLTLWHFFDFKGNDAAQRCGPCHYLPDFLPPVCGWYNMTGDCSSRPGGMNHKGVVDFYRRKKPVFDVVKAKYARAASAIVI